MSPVVIAPILVVLGVYAAKKSPLGFGLSALSILVPFPYSIPLVIVGATQTYKHVIATAAKVVVGRK